MTNTAHTELAKMVNRAEKRAQKLAAEYVATGDQDCKSKAFEAADRAEKKAAATLDSSVTLQDINAAFAALHRSTVELFRSAEGERAEYLEAQLRTAEQAAWADRRERNIQQWWRR